MDYLQLPVMIGYKFCIGNHFSIKPSVGGYYAVGVGGYALIDGVDAFNQPYTERGYREDIYILIFFASYGLYIK